MTKLFVQQARLHRVNMPLYSNKEKKKEKTEQFIAIFLVILAQIFISIDLFVIYPLGQFRVPKTYICVHVLLTEWK